MPFLKTRIILLVLVRYIEARELLHVLLKCLLVYVCLLQKMCIKDGSIEGERVEAC